MKILLVAAIAVFCENVVASSWTVTGVVENPESVFYDAAENLIYVSSVAGDGQTKDGKGWISVVSPAGRVVSAKWVDGLNAPKGLRSHKGTLWVTDIDEVVSIDMKSGKISGRLKIEGAKFLNDPAIAPDGTVYVSDSLTSTIHSIKNGRASVLASGPELESPNGLCFRQGRLYVAAWGLTSDWNTKVPGRIYYIDIKSKKITHITKKPLGNLDGLEFDKNNKFLVSDWVAGRVYSVDAKGVSKVIHAGSQGIADIGYVPSLDLLVMPNMKESRVEAVRVK
ncbi:MAG: hypothetical protein A2583_12450 [Bdellovibrionales bacterium RIFOXYD1_FULL_53_11]|nr:MAG: hypothetical protein A2583_12450 [Bdellovibrionales bacterium RIFOXYD1_FULL_53_11]